MKALRRRALLSAAVLAALGVVTAGCLLFRQARPAALPAETAVVVQAEEDPLTRFRTQRQQLRQKQRAELNDIIHDADTDAETLSMAQRQLLSLMENETAEATLEGLLSARGFQDPLVSANAGAVYVMVRSEGLDRRETAIILDLALRETGVTAGNVKILAIN